MGSLLFEKDILNIPLLLLLLAFSPPFLSFDDGSDLMKEDPEIFLFLFYLPSCATVPTSSTHSVLLSQFPYHHQGMGVCVCVTKVAKE